MNALLRTAGQDAPPTGWERTRYYEQRGMSQNRKLNDPITDMLPLDKVPLS